jgi:hypothetical protein
MLPRNLCVNGIVLLSILSLVCSSQRDRRPGTSCKALHPQFAGFCFGHRGELPRLSGTKTALCHLPGIARPSKETSMVSGAYLRHEAEILIAMSRATLDLGIAGRLRQMASELPARAAEQENECGFADNEVASFKRPVRMGS